MGKKIKGGRSPVFIGCVFILAGWVFVITDHLVIGLGSAAIGIVMCSAGLGKTNGTGTAGGSDTSPKT